MVKIIALLSICFNVYLLNKSVDCSITFSDATGNRHQFIGKGEVW